MMSLPITPPPAYLRSFFFFNDTATTEIYTLSLHDALPIFASTTWWSHSQAGMTAFVTGGGAYHRSRSEEHTSELQSQFHLVCRLLLEKKNNPSSDRDFQPSVSSSPCWRSLLGYFLSTHSAY